MAVGLHLIQHHPRRVGGTPDAVPGFRYRRGSNRSCQPLIDPAQMKRPTLTAALLLISALVFVPQSSRGMSPVGAAPLADSTSQVEAAVRDYVEALYDVAPERIARSVHRDMTKLGLARGEDGAYRAYTMTYDELYDLAGRWNVDNRQNITAETVKEIAVLDVLDKTATAKLTAQWGIDYMHLLHTSEGWKIIQVLWQTHPPRDR